jgi:hypothetical protein
MARLGRYPEQLRARGVRMVLEEGRERERSGSDYLIRDQGGRHTSCCSLRYRRATRKTLSPASFGSRRDWISQTPLPARGQSAD